MQKFSFSWLIRFHLSICKTGHILESEDSEINVGIKQKWRQIKHCVKLFEIWEDYLSWLIWSYWPCTGQTFHQKPSYPINKNYWSNSDYQTTKPILLQHFNSEIYIIKLGSLDLYHPLVDRLYWVTWVIQILSPKSWYSCCRKEHPWIGEDFKFPQTWSEVLRKLQCCIK